MQVAGFDWQEVRVSHLAVSIDGRDGIIALHSTDPEFALRLAEALVAAHSRLTAHAIGKSAIVKKETS